MPRRPHILLILTDQQRGDCLGIDGHPVLHTPHMDFIGGTGTHFRRGYSEAPTCVPARRTIMSGQAPAVNGMVGHTGVPWDPEHTLAGELTQAGYQSEMIGKLHLSPKRKRFGFQHMQLADSTRSSPHNDYITWLNGPPPQDRWAMAHGVTPNGWVGRPTHLPETQTHAFWVASQAINFLEARDPAAPFFLNVSFIDPHPPLAPPQFFFDRYVNQELPKPVIGDWAPKFEAVTRGIDPEDGIDRMGWLDDQSMQYFRAAYFGLISHVDAQLGRLLTYMRDRRLLDDTFILFTSDHGEMLGDHHMFSKSRAFEGSARVPFVARAPLEMGTLCGSTVDVPVGLQDVMPTLLDAAGVPIPKTVSGRTLLPLMRGDRGEWRDVLHGEHAIMSSYSPDEAMHYLTDGHMKYIWYSQTGRELLFDLDRDPIETHNLLFDADAERRVASWRGRMVQELRERPEGFVIGDSLVAGRPHDHLVPGRNRAPKESEVSPQRRKTSD